MPTILCPRNREVHYCPNEELGDTIFWDYMELPATTRCAAVCKGELTFYIASADHETGARESVEFDSQTCECKLTEREWNTAAEQVFEREITQMEDYYHERPARQAIDGYDY